VPGGKVAIVEYKGAGGFSFHKLFGHYVNPSLIVEELSQAGFQLEKSLDFLPEQSFNIFEPKN